jgi:hypothetical protein
VNASIRPAILEPAGLVVFRNGAAAAEEAARELREEGHGLVGWRVSARGPGAAVPPV